MTLRPSTLLAASALLASATALATTTADLWWQILYLGHTNSVDGCADPDGDGADNAEERAGRTDPLDEDDLPDFLSLSATGVIVTIGEDDYDMIRLQAQWLGHGGVQYRIEFQGSDQNWHTWTHGVTVPIIGDDILIVVDEIAEEEDIEAVRLVFDDPDSDNDGYSDWQEFLAGTDPDDNQSVPSFGLGDGDDDGFSAFAEWLLGLDAGDPNAPTDTDGSSRLLGKAAGEDDLLVLIPGTGFGLIEIDPVTAGEAPSLRITAL